MTKQQIISDKLIQAFSPSHFELLNESFMHNVPKGSESHFKAVIVSDAFAALRMVQRHQLVYQAMGATMKDIHALALHTFTQAEWQEKGEAAASPQCHGGEQRKVISQP